MNKLYVIKVFKEDYFFVYASSQKEAINKLQVYWNPINNGMGKLYECVKGFSEKELLEGRHLAFFQNKLNEGVGLDE